MEAEIYQLSLPEDCVPILISVPHCGQIIPDGLGFKSKFKNGLSDCDVLVDRVYDFAVAMRIPIIKANYHRYVIDLNRPPNDEPLYARKTTPLCTTVSFEGERIYEDERDVVNSQDVARRKLHYYDPYHRQLQELLQFIHAKHGQVLLYEAHSIQRCTALLDHVPLSDIVLGTNNQTSCDPRFSQIFEQIIAEDGFSLRINDPLKGGYITRAYGLPHKGFHAIQVERSYDVYLDEHLCLDDFKVKRLSQSLRRVFESFLTWMEKHQRS